MKPIIKLDKENFHEWIMACCDTFLRNEDKLFALFNDKTTAIDITFPIRISEIPTMEINICKVIQNNEEKIVVIKNLESSEVDENEN